MDRSQNLQENDAEMIGEGSESKKIKISSTDEVKSNTLTLESLPVEMFIQIFNFLPLNDVLNATLVSKEWNTIISNSSRLLSKIKYKYEYCKDKKNWSGSRKYPNIQIQCRTTHELSSLKCDKSSVKFLILNFNSTSLHELGNLLMTFENLEELHIYCRNLNKCEEFEPLPKRELRSLKFLSNNCEIIDPIMELFSNWQVNELTITNRVNLMENQNVVKFLMNQNNLEHLDVDCIDFEQLENAKFKLKSFKISNFDEVEINALAKFLQNHQEFLTKLKIYGITDEMAEVLNKFTKLKKLTVQGGISKLFKLSTVESLILIHCYFEGSFPFVKELYLYRCSVSTLEDMKYLHKLTISNTKLGEISIPTVRILTLKLIYFRTRPFKFETSNLDELEIFSLRLEQDWIIDYLDRSETQLKKLKFVDCFITAKLVAAIERNRSKIKYFETASCKEKSDEDDWGVPCDFSALKQLFFM